MHEDRDHRYTGLLESVSFQPVFIMGDHRSGTTLLYRLLDATGCFNVVTAYHILCYDRILSNHAAGRQEAAKRELAAGFAARGISDRMIDGVAVTPELPEEYGFVLSNAYRAQLQADNLARLLELGKKVQYVAAAPKPLLLKNPWDYFLNFVYVKQVFPYARFVFLHRHPLDVINSQLRAIRSSLQAVNPYLALMSAWYAGVYERPARRALMRGLFSSHFELGLRITSRHVARATSYYLENIARLPADDYCSLTYEQLCADPEHSIDAILGFLGLQPAAGPAFAELIKPRALPALPEVTRRQGSIRRRMQAYYDHHGYT